MSYDMYPCLKTIEFVKNIIGLTCNITVDTNIFSMNITDGENGNHHCEDIYVIEASSKNKISIDKIINLFKHMKYQIECFEELFDVYAYFDGIKYNKQRKIYEILLKDRKSINPFYNLGATNCIYALEFTQNILGLKKNVLINSNIFSHIFPWEHKEYGLDTSEDMYMIYGNADKKITIDDIYDLFNDMHSQLIIIDEKNIGRSYCLEGIKIDNEHYKHLSKPNTIQYSIRWGS
jgi:hypothetical protein